MAKQPKRLPNKCKLTPLFIAKVKPQETPSLSGTRYSVAFALQVQPTGYKALKVIYRYLNRPRWYHSARPMPLA
jgi:hypothetical protein